MGGEDLLPGLTKDSVGALRQASLFALPSRFEGYPNALLEALGCGLPVIATACPGGTAAILANGVHGMLVPPNDVPALTVALGRHDVVSGPPRGLCRAGATCCRGLDIAVVSKRWLDLFERAKAARFRLKNLCPDRVPFVYPSSVPALESGWRLAMGLPWGESTVAAHATGDPIDAWATPWWDIQ